MVPLDRALEYVSQRWTRLLPIYALALAPCTAVVLLLVDAISSQHRSALSPVCLLLALATLWRWAWLIVLQRRVQSDMRGVSSRLPRSRFFWIVLTRLYSSFAVTWGSFALFPAFYGFYLSAFVTPALLESPGSAPTEIKRAIILIHRSMGRLVKGGLTLGLVLLLALLNVVAAEFFLLRIVFTSMLGMPGVDIQLTISSLPWTLFVFYAMFLVFDFYWTVAAVFVFYDLQANKLGADLRSRLNALKARTA